MINKVLHESNQKKNQKKNTLKTNSECHFVHWKLFRKKQTNENSLILLQFFFYLFENILSPKYIYVMCVCFFSNINYLLKRLCVCVWVKSITRKPRELPWYWWWWSSEKIDFFQWKWLLYFKLSIIQSGSN